MKMSIFHEHDTKVKKVYEEIRQCNDNYVKIWELLSTSFPTGTMNMNLARHTKSASVEQPREIEHHVEDMKRTLYFTPLHTPRANQDAHHRTHMAAHSEKEGWA
jgi:hypothetical protein